MRASEPLLRKTGRNFGDALSVNHLLYKDRNPLHNSFDKLFALFRRGHRRLLVRLIRPGGLILFSRNIQNARQIRDLTDVLFGAIRIPPFIALDQEGGRVSRLKDVLGPTPAPFDLARRATPVRRQFQGTFGRSTLVTAT